MASDDKVRNALLFLDDSDMPTWCVSEILAHIDHLTAEVSRLREWSGELNVLLDTAKQERDAAEANARRYLWLRSKVLPWFTLLEGFKGSEYRNWSASSWEAMDAAIDTARGR